MAEDDVMLLETASRTTKKTALWEALSDADKTLPVFSFSQLSTADKCMFLWEMQYKMGYVAGQSKALYTGSIIHLFAQDLYEHLQANPGLSVAEWKATRLSSMVQELYQASEHGETMQNTADAAWLFARYLEVQPTYDADWEVMDVERHFLSKFVTPQGREILIQGYIDLIVRSKSSGRIWLIDHKSGQKFWTPNECLIDPQMPTYMALMRAMGLDAFGIVINQFNTYPYKKKDEVDNMKLFKREPMHRTPAEVDNVLLEMLMLADDVIDAQADPNHQRRSLRKDCGKFCSHFDPCLFSLKGMPVEVVLKDSFIKKENAKQPSITKSKLVNEVGITLEI